MHLIASYDFGGPAVSGILYASQNEWRIGPVGDLSAIVGGNDVVSNSEEGLDNLAVFMSAKYPIGQHTISGSVGFLKSKWQGAETKWGHDEGTMTMAGLVYYYNFSKRTNFYGAASWSDGRGAHAPLLMILPPAYMAKSSAGLELSAIFGRRGLERKRAFK